MRACENCEWGRRGKIVDPDLLYCREGPTPVLVDPTHWCGRFRVAERLTGGRDVRGKS